MYKKEENTENERRGMSSVLAHELAHQWFGNLITCKWWIDAWVNEGFASYVQFLGMRHTTPEFEPMKVRLVEAFQAAMRSDVLENSHPTRLPDKGSPYDTMNYLSALVYQKGSAIIRMMEQFLTERTLQVGLQNFLKKFSFEPVEQDDLFEVLNEQAHADGRLPADMTMKQIMDTWTLQRGYPLVKVSRAGSSRVYISQEKFVNMGSDYEDFTWYIPVAIATQDNPDFSDALPDFWFDPGSLLLSRSHDTTKWIIVNAGATGYYRVIYDKPLTDLIVQQLKEDHTVIEHGSRSQLIDDYFTSAFQNYTSLDSALEFTLHLGMETEYTVWTPTLFHLRKFRNMYLGYNFENLQLYLGPKINQVLQTIGFEQDTSDIGNIVLFREQLLEWACLFSDVGCTDYAKRLWTEWQAAPETNNFPIDLRQLLYCQAVRGGSSADVAFTLARYLVEIRPKQKQWLINALGCASEPLLIQESLDKSLDETSGIVKSDVVFLFRSAANNANGRNILMSYMDAQIDKILSYMGDASLISSAISTLSTYYRQAQDLERVQTFVDKHAVKLESVMGSLNTSLANIRSNMEWTERYYTYAESWFFLNIGK